MSEYSERFAREKAKREQRSALARKGKKAPEAPFTITWLDPPVVTGRVKIVGVCSDASDAVRARYL